MQKKDQHFIKRENTNLILNLIQKEELISRSELAKLARMSPTTVSRIVSTLIEMDLVQETNEYTSGVGRRATKLTLNANAALTLGVAVDEHEINIIVINLHHKVLFTKTSKKRLSKNPNELAKFIKNEIDFFIEDNEIQSELITGVGIAIPGIIDHQEGIVYKSAQLAWEGVQFKEILEQEINFPIYIDNELNLRSYAEMMSSDNHSIDSMIVIGFGSGVGSALIEGELISRGVINGAGEIGHTVVTPNGILCTCGNIGCLQTYVAEGFLLEEANKHASCHTTLDIIKYAEDGANWAKNILERAITYAAIAINNSICMSNPEEIILTGSLIESSEWMSEEIIKRAQAMLWYPFNEQLTIGVSKLGEIGEALGAAMYSQEEHISQLFTSNELVSNR